MSVSQTSADASRPNQRKATLTLLHGSSICFFCLLYCWVSLSVVRFLARQRFCSFSQGLGFSYVPTMHVVCRDISVGTATHYALDVPGIESRRFSSSVQTGPGAHPASYAVGTGSFPGLKLPRRGCDHKPQLEPRLKKKDIYICSPLLDLRSLF